MLDAITLKSTLQKLLDAPPASIEEAAQAWSSAYITYAQGATAAGGTPVITNGSILQLAILAAMQSQQFLQQLPLALTTFWMVPPVVFASPAFVGPVSLVPGSPILASTLAIIGAANIAGTSDPIGPIADALDVFTKTIVVALVNTVSGATVPTPLL